MANLSYMQYPRLQTLYDYMRQADQDDGKARSVQNLMKILEFIPIKNTRIRGHILTRKTAVGSWQWGLVPLEKSAETRTQEANTRLKSIIGYISSSRVQTPLYGCFCAKLNWVSKNGGILPLPVKNHKPSLVETYDDSSVALYTGNNAKQVITPDMADYIYESDGEIFRGGLMRSVAIMEIMRYDMIMEWASYNKKLKGLIHGINKGGDEDREVLNEALRRILENNYMTTDDLVDVTFHQITAAGAGGSFKEFNDQINNSIAIGILGQANTPELPASGGSRAALQIQQLVSADIMYYDVLATEQLINEKLLPVDFFKNTQSQEPPPYEFKVKIAEPVDLEATANYLQVASTFIPLDLPEVYKKLELTQPQTGQGTPLPQSTAGA